MEARDLVIVIRSDLSWRRLGVQIEIRIPGDQQRSPALGDLLVVLDELIRELPVSARLSPTYRVLSSYHYRLYSAKMTIRMRLKVGDNRWVTKRELLAGRMDSGEKIAAWHAKAIDDQLPGGLDGVALSFPEELSGGFTVR